MFKHIGYAVTILILVASLAQTVQSQTIIWETNLGGMLNEMGNSCQVMPDSSIIIIGSTYSFGFGLSDIYLIKTDNLGSPVWTRQYGGDSTDFGYDVQVTSDGGFIIVGSTKSNTTSKQVYLIKTDSAGTVEWEKTFGGSGNEEGQSVRQTSDKGYIIGGTTNSIGNGFTDMYLCKTD